MHGPIYDFFRDQGSLIAGFLALIAGGVAYLAGWQQARATKKAAWDQVQATEIAANVQVAAVKEAIRVQAETEQKRREQEVETVRRSLAVELRQMVARAWSVYLSVKRLIEQPSVPITARMIEDAVGALVPVVYPAVADRISFLDEAAVDLVIVYQLLEIGREFSVRLMRSRDPDNIPPSNAAVVAEAFLTACVNARGLLPKLRTGVDRHDEKDSEMIQKITEAEQAWRSVAQALRQR